MSIYSRPAFLAEKTLADAGIVVTKNHLRELIAALCGFNSLAALQASPLLPAGEPPDNVLLVVNRALATARCKHLLPDLAPAPILNELVRFLDTNAASTVAIHQSPSLPLPSLQRFAQRQLMALTEPNLRMLGGNAKIQCSTDFSGHLLVGQQLLIAQLTGEYSTPSGDGGVVQVELRYRTMSHALYMLDSHDVKLMPGEDLVSAADMDFQFPSYGLRAGPRRWRFTSPASSTTPCHSRR